MTTTDEGLTPRREAIMLEMALRKGWIDPSSDWTPEERREVIDRMLGLARGSDARGMVAAARVLATLERNVISDRRNQIAETGQELSAATDRLRTTLSSPEARQALAALSSAVTSSGNVEKPHTTPLLAQDAAFTVDQIRPLTDDGASVNCAIGGVQVSKQGDGARVPGQDATAE